MFHSLKRKYGVKFLYIVALLNKYILVQRTVWVLVVMVLVVIDPYSRRHDVFTDNHSCVRWNVHFMERFLRSNEINFYSLNY